jgi:membrane-associated phospholipid phosphatase
MKHRLRWLTRPWGPPPHDDYHLGERIGLGAMAVVLFIPMWFGTQWLVAGGDRFYDVSLPIDDLIPLCIPMIWGYLAMYLFVALTYLMIRRRWLYRTWLVGILVQSLIASVVFVAFPVRMVDRPDLEVALTPGISAVLLGMFYATDAPLNLFPSLHLGSALFCGYALVIERPGWRWAIAALVVLTAFSVVLVRQHYVMDAVAGIALATVMRSVLVWARRKYE